MQKKNWRCCLFGLSPLEQLARPFIRGETALNSGNAKTHSTAWMVQTFEPLVRAEGLQQARRTDRPDAA